MPTIQRSGSVELVELDPVPRPGPDESVLGDVNGKRVLALGSGAGANLAHLATLGAICTGVDIAPSPEIHFPLVRKRIG